MIVTYVTLSILALATSIGAFASWLIIKKGIPHDRELQAGRRQPERFRNRLRNISLNLAGLFLGPAIILPFLEPAFDLAFPGMGWMCLQVLIILLFDDTWFYWWHRLLHENKTLYRLIHKDHHRAFAPLPLDYIHVHPVEISVGAIGPVIGMLFVEFYCGGLNAWSFWSFVIWRQAHELNIHSGVKSAWLHKVLFISPAENHDLHHAKPHCGNYGSLFSIWDQLMGTTASLSPKKLP